MAEYATVIELWLEANGDEQAQEIVDLAATYVRGTPGVTQVEVEIPEAL